MNSSFLEVGAAEIQPLLTQKQAERLSAAGIFEAEGELRDASGKGPAHWFCAVRVKYADLLPSMQEWWRDRITLCRAAGLPVCNAPETIAATALSSLDVMFSRQLLKDSQIRWASTACRPDLGESSLALVDAQEESVEALRLMQDLGGRDGINRPGVYRSVCLEVNLRTKLCVCALQHARYLSDMEGGELSKKMIRKVGADRMRNMDHSSEASVTNLESLVSMVQDVVHAQTLKAKDMAEVRRAWAQHSEVARRALQEAGLNLDAANCDDGHFREIMAEAQCQDSRLSAKLQELREEWSSLETLLDGLYGWLASPTSLLYDAALLRRVHQYMDRVLKLFIDAVKRNGCRIIHASHTKANPRKGSPLPKTDPFRAMEQMAEVETTSFKVPDLPQQNATKAASNLPTCYYMSANGAKSYDGDFQWVIELEKGWSAWMPNNEPYLGGSDQTVRYAMGRYEFEVTFEDETHGLQTNLTTGKSRRIQRLQRGEPMPAWEFRESRQQQQVISKPVETKPQRTEAPKLNATKIDSNLPTCCVMATPTKSYDGDFQWVIELEKGWSSWMPNNEPYLGGTDEPMRYSMGRYDFEVTFEDETHGLQTNVTTGKSRRIQRLQRGEPMPAWEFRESRQQQQPAKSASRPAERKPAPAEPKARATKVDSNLPTCAVVGTSVKKTYEGDFQWVIELEKGWDTWLPQDAPYLGGTDEVMRYSMGRYDFEVHFDSDDKGVQTNLTTGKTRRVQRLQKGEPMPAWEGTGTRRRTAGAPAEPAVPKSSAAAAAQANRTVRRTGDTKPTPAQRPQVSQSAYPANTGNVPHYMRGFKSRG
ncbi:unnamed protein product [Effrenium voratum]|nr:unnamed protein product [Effrenium voratum]